MAEIVNLNKIRKTKVRDQHDSQARANRVKYGRTKAEKDSDTRAKDRRDRSHLGKKLEDE
jgi:hypothetical protein